MARTLSPEQKEKNRLRSNAWAAANREIAAARSRAWYAANKGRHKAGTEARIAADPEGYRARRKAEYLRNADKIRAERRALPSDHPTRVADRERASKWSEENRERKRVSDAKLYAEKREERLESGRAYRRAPENRQKLRARGARKKATRAQRTPQWLTASDFERIAEFYALAERLTVETGIEHHVDHIIPMRGKRVSGLHVPDNLQVLPATENMRKKNHFVP